MGALLSGYIPVPPSVGTGQAGFRGLLVVMAILLLAGVITAVVWYLNPPKRPAAVQASTDIRKAA